MKKILFVVEAMAGGIFTYISDLSNKLSEQYDVYIAYSVRKQTPENYKEYFNKNIKLIRVNNFTREIDPKKDIKALFELRRVAKKIKPDIIHLHSSKAGVLGRIAFSGKKRNLFYTPHGYSFLMPNISQKKSNFYKGIEKVCGLSGCVTIACSKSEYNATLRLTSKARYVNNGINIDSLEKYTTFVDSNEDIGKKNKKLKIVTLGRIAFQKNPELFNHIAEKFPDDNFVWIGDGDLREKLTSSNIEITGWLNRSDAIKRMQDADIFLLTSRYEGLPMALLEAMYMKKVCIVSNVVGNKDVITSKNGFLCESLEDFSQAITMVKNENVSDKIANAYNDILSEYNTDHMVKKYTEIYKYFTD